MRLDIYKLILAISGSCSSIAIHAGTISSGGGLIFGNEVNPWFLEHTPTVKYCIDIDEVHFGLNAEKARKQVVRSIADWKDIFANNAWTKIYGSGELVPFGNIHLATQTFEEQPCSEAVDLKFQFGTLTSEQIANSDIKTDSTIALTVRTQYDEAQLKGRGFIYVAPQTGPFKFSNSSVIADPWNRCEGCLLRMTLMHELGHVFGLSHFGDRGSLMGELFVESLVQKDKVDAIERDHAWESLMQNFDRSKKIFGAETDYAVIRCDIPLRYQDDIVKFLNVDRNTKCIKAEIKNQEHLVIYGGEYVEGPFHEIGHTVSLGAYHGSSRSLIRIRLNKSQKVFSKIPEEDIGVMGPARQDKLEWRNAGFQLIDGSKKFISFTMKPTDGLDIQGAVDGRIFSYDATP